MRGLEMLAKHIGDIYVWLAARTMSTVYNTISVKWIDDS